MFFGYQEGSLQLQASWGFTSFCELAEVGFFISWWFRSSRLRWPKFLQGHGLQLRRGEEGPGGLSSVKWIVWHPNIDWSKLTSKNSVKVFNSIFLFLPGHFWQCGCSSSFTLWLNLKAWDPVASALSQSWNCKQRNEGSWTHLHWYSNVQNARKVLRFHRFTIKSRGKCQGWIS